MFSSVTGGVDLSHRHRPLDLAHLDLTCHGGVYGGAVTDVERLAYHRAVRTFAPQVSIAAVRKTLKKRRRFDAAARALADGAPRCSLAPVVDGYMRCLSANCAEWRAANPAPKPDGREHGYPRTALIELARELRQASAARGLGSLGLVGGA